MTIEEKLHDAMATVASHVEPPDSAWDAISADVARRTRTTGALGRSITILLAFVLSGGGFLGLWLVFHDENHVPPPTVRSTAPSPTVSATIDVGGPPRAIGAGPDGVWVVVNGQSGAPLLVRIDPSTDSVVRRIALPGFDATYLVAAEGSVWVTDVELRGTRLLRIDADTGSTIASIPVDGEARAAGAGAVWAIAAVHRGRAGSILKIDPGTNRVVATIDLPDHLVPTGVAIDGNTVWALGSRRITHENPVGTSKLVQIDAQKDQVVAVIAVDASADLLAAGGGSVWLEAPDSTVIRVDGTTGSVEKSPSRIPGGFRPFAATSEGVWFIGSKIPDVNGRGMTLVSHLDPKTMTVDGSVPIPEGINGAVPPSATIDPAGVIWVSGSNSDVTRVNP